MVIGLMFSLTANAQKYRISGIVHQETKPLAYASIALQADSSLPIAANGAMSNEQGQFELNSIQAGSYYLTISLIGHKSYKRHLYIHEDLDLGKIGLLQDTVISSGVTVTASKPLVSRKADRYVLNVAQSILASGRNTFELLNYAPGVMTVGNGITINGNSATKVMVDGRLLRLSADQIQNYLANLRSEEVESIEVIPIPGAEYEAEGGGGMLNIKLKKKRSAGLSGTLGLGAVSPEWPTYNTNEQLNYGNKGLQLYASHNYSHRNSYGTFEDQRQFGTQTYQVDTRSDYINNSNNYRFGAGYDFDNNHYLGVEFNGNNNSSNSSTISNSVLNDPANNIYNKINGNFLTGNKNGLYSLSLNYNWNLDTLGSTLNLTGDYTWSNRNSNGNFRSQYEDINENFLLDSVYQNRVPTTIKNYNVALDYNKKWKGRTSLKLGGKFTRTHTLNDVRYEYLHAGKYVFDSTRSNVFDYTEEIAAAYLQYAKDWDKTSFQVGLRIENTRTNGISVTTATQFKREYTNLFPSLYLKHDFSEKHTLSFSYAYRLDRPTFSILNPFELRTDDYTFVKGNPDLHPQYTHSLQLSYLFAKKYDLTFFTQLTNGVFGQPLSNGGSNSIVSEYLWQNMSHNYNYGANLYLPIKITKWWTTTNNILLYHNILEYTGGENAKTIFQGKSTQNITVKKNWKIELSGYYQSSYNIGNLVFVPYSSIDIGLSKSFIDNKLNIRLLATDIFNTNRMDYQSVGSGLSVTEKQKYLTRKFSIQLTYNFRTGKKINVKKVEAGNSKEKSRMN
jgi:outer membrane receptor protein involved in Fe transport